MIDLLMIGLFVLVPGVETCWVICRNLLGKNLSFVIGVDLKLIDEEE